MYNELATKKSCCYFVDVDIKNKIKGLTKATQVS